MLSDKQAGASSFGETLLFLLTMKYIYSLRHLLEPVQFTFALPNKAFAVAGKFPQLALVFVWGYNWPGADRV